MHDDYDNIEALSEDNQIELMEEWFREHFENPAERTPYESAEGGYIYIWGGPFDAHEELCNKFGRSVPDKVIEELADELSSESPEWAPVASEDDYDRSLYEVVSSNRDSIGMFNNAVVTIRDLLRKTANEPRLEPLHPLLFANVISALETYLSDTFINTVLTDPVLLQKFLETTPYFKNRSVPFSDILRMAEKAPEEAKIYLLDVVWHNIGKVQAMYHATLQINFQSAIKDVVLAIATRHDIVHRNGKKKDGSRVLISAIDVEKLIVDVSNLVNMVEEQIDKVE